MVKLLQFGVWTDHKNLIQLQKIKSESTILNRLRIKSIGFDFKIIYKKGIFNQANFLSRYPIENNITSTNEHQINIVDPRPIISFICSYCIRYSAPFSSQLVFLIKISG